MKATSAMFFPLRSAIVLLAIASCSSTPAASPDGANKAPLAAPLADSATASSQSPRAAAAGTQSYRKTVLLENLEHPWGMAWLPDGAILITERPGRLRIFRNGRLDPAAIAGLPNDILAAGQGGLMDIALHPKFAENRFIYFTYAHGTRDANRTRLARAKFDGTRLSNVQVIFEVSPVKSGTQHFGSRLAWLPDGTLLLATGDGGNPPLQLGGQLIRNQAQNLRSHLGKVVRLKDDGSIPPDNPFATSKQGLPALWSYGHRNPQGLTVDPATGQVWQTEHGSRGGDELNRIEGGKNFGWPLVTFSEEYSGGPISSDTSRPGLVDPKLQWTPAIAPSGLVVYRGDRFPAWRGQLFAGGLVSQDIRRIQVDGQGKATELEKIEIGQRVRDVRQGPDGLLYVLTDQSNGSLIRIEPQP
ncbi:MAG: PQQ-dependent sugar dehydrogenase [Thermosynechococcaceae cyanobacterium MS004]|nr:PQQ-dependent sugar dehydrogenase [Thermosynechococcaceae cyanobacterium MS004]